MNRPIQASNIGPYASASLQAQPESSRAQAAARLLGYSREQDFLPGRAGWATPHSDGVFAIATAGCAPALTLASTQRLGAWLRRRCSRRNCFRVYQLQTYNQVAISYFFKEVKLDDKYYSLHIYKVKPY